VAYLRTRDYILCDDAVSVRHICRCKTLIYIVFIYTDQNLTSFYMNIYSVRCYRSTTRFESLSGTLYIYLSELLCQPIKSTSLFIYIYFLYVFSRVMLFFLFALDDVGCFFSYINRAKKRIEGGILAEFASCLYSFVSFLGFNCRSYRIAMCSLSLINFFNYIV
jgi:hypothetical protein